MPIFGSLIVKGICNYFAEKGFTVKPRALGNHFDLYSTPLQERSTQIIRPTYFGKFAVKKGLFGGESVRLDVKKIMEAPDLFLFPGKYSVKVSNSPKGFIKTVLPKAFLQRLFTN